MTQTGTEVRKNGLILFRLQGKIHGRKIQKTLSKNLGPDDKKGYYGVGWVTS